MNSRIFHLFPLAIMLAAATISAQIPHAPTLAFPADSAENVTLTPTAVWYDVYGAVTYGLEVSLDSTFTTLVFSDTTITDTSRAIGPLSAGTTYYWRANASNQGLTGPWSTIWNFTTSIPTQIIPPISIPQKIITEKVITYDLLGRVVEGTPIQTRRSVTNGYYIYKNGDQIKKSAVVRKR